MNRALIDVTQGIPVSPETGRSKPVSAAELLKSPPAQQQYVIDGFLPEPIVAAISSPGGLGKSHMLLAISAAVAGGGDFLGYKVKNPGGVLYVSAEDDQEEIKRRLWALTSILEDDPEHNPEAFSRNLHIWSTVGENFRLLKDFGHSKEMSEALGDIVDAASSVENLRLVILDPVSRFRSGDENNSEDATRFVEALEHIRKATGVTVLVAHHSRKNASGDTADSIRGSSALVDALRFAATLSLIPPDQVGRYGLTEPERRDLVRLNIVKTNYKVSASELWLKRSQHGVLSLTETPVRRKAGPPAKNTKSDSQKLLNWLRNEKKADRFHSVASLRQLSGEGGRLGMSKRTVEKVIKEALEGGTLYKVKEGKNRWLEFNT